MKRLSEIRSFISEIFEKYQQTTFPEKWPNIVLNGKHVTLDIDDYRECLDIFDDDIDTIEADTDAGKILDQVIDLLTVPLGMSKDEILNCDYAAAMRIWNKYPFFEYFEDYLNICELQNNYDIDTNNNLLVRRFNSASVVDRMMQLLREMDAVRPGTWHKDATITRIQIMTRSFVTFLDCNLMLKNYCDILNTVKRLFFKALHSELTVEEQREYDFFVVWLRAGDRVAPNILMTYQNIGYLRQELIKDNFSNFASYVKIRRSWGAEPWGCKEFYDDMELVYQFAEFYPDIKKEMRKFCNEAINFQCSFIWSDAPAAVPYDPEDEALFQELERDDYVFIPEEERAREETIIYVPKTPEELEIGVECVERLKHAVASSSIGGIVIPSVKTATAMDHMNAYVRGEYYE